MLIFYSYIDLRFYSPQWDTTLHCEATDSGLYTFIIHCVRDNYPAFAGTHCTYAYTTDNSVVVGIKNQFTVL